MPSAITITISSPGRAIVADGRLVAGESADVSVTGGIPAALYLVAASRDVVAACTSFVPGESSATGVLNLATVPLAEIVDEVPAGRAIPLQAILEDAAGAVIGYGLLNVVSAPMPDALDPLDEDLIYAKLSDLRYAIDPSPRDPDPETGAYQLSDRAVNLVETSAAAVWLTFPAEVSGRGRDFFVVLNSTATGTGNVTLTITGGEDILTPDGNMPDTPHGKMTILYFSEIFANGFLFKAETVTTV